MKKLFSIFAVATMAICTMVFTSCSNDDDKTYTFNVTVNSVRGADEATVKSTVASVFSSKLSGIADVNNGSSFTITTTQPVEVQNALKDAYKDMWTALHKTSATNAYILVEEVSDVSVIPFVYEYVSNCTITFGVNNEFLALYDITYTRTSDSGNSEINLANGTAGTVTDDEYTAEGKFTTDSFQPILLTSVDYKVTCTLKSNWKEILSTMDPEKGVFFVLYKDVNDYITATHNKADLTKCSTEEEMKSVLEEFANCFLEYASPSMY